MRRFCRGLLLAVVLSAGASAAAAAEPLTFAAFGDMPYRQSDIAPMTRLIAAIDRSGAAFSVHVGDIKNGGSRCTDAGLLEIRDLFNRAERPLIYTPGDNEWTDCHRGGDDPLQRLQRIRDLFFAGDASFGRRPMPLERQSRDPQFRLYVENNRWQLQGVVFATLHVVGSNDNLGRDAANDAEHAARLAANLAWLGSTFDLARADRAAAVVLFMQADPWLSDLFSRRSGFRELLAAMTEQAGKFAGPVLLVHGDSHEYRIDQPFEDPTRGAPLENFTRLEVPGNRDVRAVKVRFDAAAKRPFSFSLIDPPN